MKKVNKLSLAIIGFIVLIVIGVSNCGGNPTTGSTSSVDSGSASGSPVGSPTVSASSVPTTAAPPPQTTAPAAPTSAAPPPQTTAPAAAPSTPTGCYPLTNGGNCYEPGEFCRKSDHGASGVAGDGKHIICEDNDGWRWEPV